MENEINVQTAPDCAESPNGWLDQLLARFGIVEEMQRPVVFGFALLGYIEIAESLWERLSLITGNLVEPLNQAQIFGCYWMATVVFPSIALVTFDRPKQAQRLSRREQFARWILIVVVSAFIGVLGGWLADSMPTVPRSLEQLAIGAIWDTVSFIVVAAAAIGGVFFSVWLKRKFYRGGDPALEFVAAQIRPTFLVSLIFALALGMLSFLWSSLRGIESAKETREMTELRGEITRLNGEILKLQGK